MESRLGRPDLAELDAFEVRLLARDHADAVYAAKVHVMREYPDLPRSGHFAERMWLAEDGRTMFAVFIFDRDLLPGGHF